MEFLILDISNRSFGLSGWRDFFFFLNNLLLQMPLDLNRLVSEEFGGHLTLFCVVWALQQFLQGQLLFCWGEAATVEECCCHIGR